MVSIIYIYKKHSVYGYEKVCVHICMLINIFPVDIYSRFLFFFLRIITIIF